MTNDAQFQCVLKNYHYQLDAIDDIQFNYIYLKQLVQTTNFIYDKFGDKKSVIINHSDIDNVRKYKKLCEKIGKESVENFIKSKNTLLNFSYINKNLENTELMKKVLLFPLLKKLFFPEKKMIDFKATNKVIDQFTNDNFFEIAGIAKNPLKKGFGENFGCADDILSIISSFLNLNDIVSQPTKPIEKKIEVSGDLIIVNIESYYE